MTQTDLVQFGLNFVPGEFDTLVVSAAVVRNCGPNTDSPLGFAIAQQGADEVFKKEKARFWAGMHVQRGLHAFPAKVVYETKGGGRVRIEYVETLEDAEIDRMLKFLA